MDKMNEFLFNVGTWASNNKYLTAIKNAFQTAMPYIIAGAIGVLWSNVIVNDQTGLGALWKPIMALQFLNPAFNAINFCTIGSLAILITFLLGSEIGEADGESKTFSGLLAVVALISVSNTSMTVFDAKGVETSVSGLFSGTLGSSGMFTGMLMAIISVELFHKLAQIEAIKIKMPDQVPPGVAKSFEVLVPVFIVLACTSIANTLLVMTTNTYINDLIFKLIQTPLMNIGGSLPGICLFIIISCLFWSVGLHGDNMIKGVLDPILTSLTMDNLALFNAGKTPTHIINGPFQRIFFATGGTGMVIGLTLAMFIVAKRPDNRSVAELSIVPNMFNIGEVDMFGYPVVLNPLLIVPFIIAPIACVVLGYALTAIGFCPIMYIQMPWTMPPFLYGLLASGGNIMGGVTQLLAILLSVVIYIPFVKMYEKQQNSNN